MARSSSEGNLIIDLFCGCATTLIAAEKLNRLWIGIDLSSLAADLAKRRMALETNIFDRFNLIHRNDLPRRTDIESRSITKPTSTSYSVGRKAYATVASTRSLSATSPSTTSSRRSTVAATT